MWFLRNNFAAITVAVAAATLVWTFGGTRGGMLLPVVPWLAVILVEVAMCFPQRRSGETSYDARERVWHAVKKDPLVWISLGLLALLAIPFLNYGLCTGCDYLKIREGFSPDPPASFLPFCVNRLDHLNVFLWFLVALPMTVAVRHSLTDAGKRLVIELIVWNGVGVAALGFIQAACGAPGPYWSTDFGSHIAKAGDFFATFGYPNMAGDYFTTLFALAVALWRRNVDGINEAHRAADISKTAIRWRGDFWKKHYFLIPAVICFFAALSTLSRAAIILVTLSVLVFFAHAFVSFLHQRHRAEKVKKGVWWLLAASVVVYFATSFLPKDLQREVDTLGTTEVLDRVSGRGQYHVRVATEIWKDHKLFGCGGWGYIHFCLTKMTPAELKKIQMVGGANVHNDYLQFLAEHGLVGFGAMVAIVVLLLSPIVAQWRGLVREARFVVDRKLRPPKPMQVFVLPAGAFAILVGALCTFIHSFGDCPMRSPAVLSLFLVSLAAVPGFISKS